MSSAATPGAQVLVRTRALVIVVISSSIAGALILDALDRISVERTNVADVGLLVALGLAAALCMAVGLEPVRRGWFGVAMGGSVPQRTGRLLLRAFWILCVAAYLLIFGTIGWRIVGHLANG